MLVPIGHLRLHEVTLSACEEWAFSSNGWCFIRSATAGGYAINGGRAIQLSKGDVLVIQDFTRTEVRASRLFDWKLQYFQVCPEALSGLLTRAEQVKIQELARDPKHGFRYFSSVDPVAKEYRKLVDKTKLGHALLVRCGMLQLCALVFSSELETDDSGSDIQMNARGRFRQIVLAMPTAELMVRTMPELAALCGCGERHLCRLFRDHFGFPFRSRRVELGLQRAQRMLREPGIRIKDIAIASGFRHVSFFNGVFKRRLGLTPSEWRAANAGKKPERKLNVSHPERF